MNFITTSDVVSAFISKHHGAAVADQFIATFYNDDPFEDQNENALQYIKETVNDLIDSACFTNNVNFELERYLDNVKDYLTSNTLSK